MAQPPAAGGGIIAALQRWWPDWTLEGPRKLTINTLIVIAGLLGSGVVVKATLKQVQVVCLARHHAADRFGSTNCSRG